MKKIKFSVVLMAALVILSGCGASNATKGGLIGGGSGAAVGALIDMIRIRTAVMIDRYFLPVRLFTYIE